MRISPLILRQCNMEGRIIPGYNCIVVVDTGPTLAERLCTLAIVLIVSLSVFFHLAVIVAYVPYSLYIQSLPDGGLLPYLICACGVLTRESFAELLRMVKSVYLTRPPQTRRREGRPPLHTPSPGYRTTQVPLLNGGMLAG